MSEHENYLQVEIYGQQYNLRGEGDPEHLRQIAQYLDEKMKAVAEVTPTVDSLKVAILAALNILEEFYQHRREDRGEEHRMDERLDRMVTLVEQELPEAS